MAQRINYLPFARKEVLSVPAQIAGQVTTGGQVTTDLARFGTDGCRAAILQDVIIFEGKDDAEATTNWAGDGGMILARFGIDGHMFLTEDLYDYRVMADKPRPNCSVWDWSCDKQFPYRIRPGQEMKVMMGVPTNTSFVYRAVMFSGQHVESGEAYHLYANNEDSLRTTTPDETMLVSPRMKCPGESAVDLFSVSHPIWNNDMGDTVPVYIMDGNDRPFWEDREWGNIIDPPTSPISFGASGIRLAPEETFRVELQNGNANVTANQNVTVTLRGVLEVIENV